MDKILSEFFSRVPKRWLMLVLLVADIIAIGGTVYLALTQLLNSNILIFWFVIASISLTVLLVIYSYFAFADVAKDRNKYRDDVEELKRQVTSGIEQSPVLTPNTSTIGLSGMTGFPDKPLNALWLCLGVSVSAINKPIDTLDLLIDSATIPANRWLGKIVVAFHADFNVTEWHMKGERQVELIAKVGNNRISSGRFPIDFNREPSGMSHRI